MKKFTDDSKSTFLYFLLFLFVLTGIFASSLVEMQGPFLVIFFLLASLYVVFAPKYFFFLYFLFLSANDLFTKEDFLFGVVGFKQILGLLLLLFFLHNRRKINYKLAKEDLPAQHWYLLKNASNIILVLYIYWLYTYFKNAYFGLHEIDVASAVTKSINSLLILASIQPFIKICVLYINKSTLYKYLIFSIFFMLTFTFLSPYLPQLGLKSIGTVQTEFETSSFQRYSGIIVNGDSNTLGVYFVLVISLLLLLSTERFNTVVYYSILVLAFFAIALSGSRTAFVSLAIVIVLFVFITKTKAYFKLALIVLLPIFLLLALPYLEMIIERMSLSSQQLDTKVDSNRIGKWILYWSFFLDNPITFLTGSQAELRIAWNDTYYTAHNVFITMVYNAGAFFALVFFAAIVRMTNCFRRMKLSKAFVLLLVPFFLLICTVSDLGIVGPFTVFVTILVLSKTETQLYTKQLFAATNSKALKSPSLKNISHIHRD